MNTNDGGTPSTHIELDTKEEMEAFDSLPRESRDLLNYSWYQYSALEVIDMSLSPIILGVLVEDKDTQSLFLSNVRC